jgi:FkbM family methyltransferase
MLLETWRALALSPSRFFGQHVGWTIHTGRHSSSSFDSLEAGDVVDFMYNFDTLEAKATPWDIVTRRMLSNLDRLIWQDRDRPTHVVDVGCGAGTMAQWLARHERRVDRVYGIEPNLTLVKSLRERRGENRRLQFVQGEAIEVEAALRSHATRMGEKYHQPSAVLLRFVSGHLNGDYMPTDRDEPMQVRSRAIFRMIKNVLPVDGWFLGQEFGRVHAYGPMKVVLNAFYFATSEEDYLSVGWSQRAVLHQAFPDCTISRLHVWQPPWRYVAPTIEFAVNTVIDHLKKGTYDKLAKHYRSGGKPEWGTELVAAVAEMVRILPLMRSSWAPGPYSYEIHEMAVCPGGLPQEIWRLGGLPVQRTALLERKFLP